VKKPWYLRRPKRKPRIGPDKLGKIIASLPPSCWRSPVRDWWVSFKRLRDDEPERYRLKRKTYAEVVAFRKEKMSSGRYYVCWLGEEQEK